MPGYLTFDYECHLDYIDLKDGDQAFQYSSRELMAIWMLIALRNCATSTKGNLTRAYMMDKLEVLESSKVIGD